MATRTISQKIQLEGEKEFNDSIKSINSNIGTLNSELSKIKEQYKGSEESTEYLSKAQETLNKKLDEQKKKVEQIRSFYEEHREELENNADAMNAWQRRLNEAERQMYQTQNQLDGLTDGVEENTSADTENSVTVGDLIDKLGIQLPAGADKALEGFTNLSVGSATELALIVAAVKAVIDITKQMIEELNEAAKYADDVNTTATTSGLSTELIQTLNYMEDLADVDPSTVTGSINKLAKAMYEASEGSETAQEKFTALGVSYQNADGTLRDSYDVFLDCIDALGNISNETERAALEQELFGRSGTDLNTVVKLGSDGFKEYADEAANVGYILDNEALTALNDYNDAVDRSQKSLDALTNQLSVQLAPGMQDFVEGWQNLRDAFLKFIEESNVVELLGDIGGLIGNLLSILGDVVDFLGGSLGEAMGVVISLLDTVIDAINWILDKIDALFDGLNSLLGITQSQSSANSELASATKSAQSASDALSASAQSTASSLNSATTSANSAAAAIQNLTSAQKTYLDTVGWDYNDAGTYWWDSWGQKHSSSEDPQAYWDETHPVATWDTSDYTSSQLAWLNKNQTLPSVSSWNASGTNSFSGGLTWVGENGPEIVSLPVGSQIYNAQESRNMSSGDTYNVTIDAKNVKAFEDIVKLAQSARVTARMNRS